MIVLPCEKEPIGLNHMD